MPVRGKNPESDPPEPAGPVRACVFAHYDRDGRVDPYVHRYLRGLREVCGRLVVVSTAALDAAEVGRLKARADHVLLRENVGYDFQSWSAGIQALDLGAFDELILCNDSCYGPFSPFRPVFEAMRERRCDFWGLTENWEWAFHLQSYFLAFRAPLIRHPLFRDFWSGVRPCASKREIVLRYEVGLTQKLLAAGFKPAAFFRPRLKNGSNPTMVDWAGLLDAGVPLIKVELLRDNPWRADLRGLAEALDRAVPGCVAEIQAHLTRTRRSPAGAPLQDGPALKESQP